MGKKNKQGKARKDKFYFLAKETGYRSRAAFKLIQLNRRFNFLGSSKVLIDLCAAPGGWMQVASKEMPVNSLIVGVDLMPILPIPNCKSIVSDITTDKCRQLIKAAILNNKADVVLHDGAPNVGTAWTIDEYTQASLCLKSFALATEFLKKGGWFVTKVFRSRDYEPLKWAVSQFFRKVRVLKPEASRQESAEIFLVGQSYLDPSHIDPKFLDPKHVFGEVDVPKSRETVVNSMLRHATKRKKAEGYDDKLYHETLLSELMNTEDPLKCLAKTNKVVCDRPELLAHHITPFFIKDSLNDIRVLGKAEIRAILVWRKRILAALDAENKVTTGVVETSEMKPVEPDSEAEEESTRKEIDRLLKDEKISLKKRLKNIRKAKRKLAERVVLKMELPGDQIEQNNANELFSLASIGNLATLETAEQALLDETGRTAADLLAMQEEEEIRRAVKGKENVDFRRAVEGGEYEQFERRGDYEADLGALESMKPTNIRGRDDIYLSDEEGDNEKLIFGSDDEGDLDSDDAEAFKLIEEDGVYDDAHTPLAVQGSKSSLLVDLDPADQETKNKHKIDTWCNSSEIQGLLNIEESDTEAHSDTEASKPAKKRTKKLVNEPTGLKSGATGKSESGKKVSFTDVPSDASESPDEELEQKLPKKEKRNQRKLRRPLTDEEKAIAVRLIQSAKSRRDLLEWNFHRFRFFEEPSTLPDWFVDDEERHMRKAAPVNIEETQVSCPVVGKTLKKAEEAKARKKMRLAKKLKSVRRRAENLPDDLTERETWSKIRTMYKNAGLLNKKRRKVHHIVNTKAGCRNQAAPPKGAKVKLVDRRMKSDKRAAERKGRGKRGNGAGIKRGKAGAKPGGRMAGKRGSRR